MWKQNWFFVPTASRLAALTGICIILAAGCTKKKEEGGTSSGPTTTDKGGAADKGGATADKGAADSGTPGITATEIKIGQTMPYSGPQSAYGVIGKTETAYFKMINEKGGINGRKINLISLDDAYTPAKAVEQVRKLVESENVAFIFQSLGTGPNTAIQKYLNDKKVPQLFVATGADKWANPQQFPWTMGWQPSYRLESQIYGKYLLKEKPNAKLCVLYQNDDFGKDYLTGLKQGLGDQYDKVVIKTASYEATDPTVDSQVVSLQSAGCDALLTAAIPKFAAQTIRKIFDINWKPFHLLSNVAISRTAVLQPAGLDKSTGVISGLYLNDPADPTLADDPGMNEYRAFMKQYLPDLDPNDGNSVYAFGVSTTLVKVLTQCGNDLSRENIMKQAASVAKLVVPVAVKGVEITTSATNFHPIAQMQLAKFNGTSFERFGEVIAAQ
jgi:branched-chain amino acid transport system substrate-binding protein